MLGPEPGGESGGAQRRPDGILQKLHDHRRPGSAAVAGPSLEEDLLHHPREPQGDTEAAPELEGEPGVLAGEIHCKSNVIAAVENHLAFGFMEEAIAGAGRARLAAP